LDQLKKRWRRLEIRLQKSRRVQRVLQDFYSGYLGFVFRTIRWEKIGFESYEADIARGVPRVLGCWHARLAFTSYLRDWTDHPLTVLASQHADARIATENMRRRGIAVIELATSGNNSKAIRDAVRAVRAGSSLGIAVDGPLGPPLVAKPGAITIAGLAGVQVAPCSYAVSRSLRLRSWDRFILPLPWCRGVLAVGDGFIPPTRLEPAEIEAATLRLAGMIDDLTRRCEQQLSRV
jgi:lysophospholipid acyltransferase (LPLAT)-like uncharacterized protein